MKVVKLTYPTSWNYSLPGLGTQFHRLTRELSGNWGEYSFAINEQIEECDYWIIYGFLEKAETTVVRESVILLLSEEAEVKRWNEQFMQQFDVVMGSQKFVNHPRYIHDHYTCPWWVRKTYDELVAMNAPVKNRNISMIASDNQMTEGHRKRYAFVKRIKQALGDDIVWFGRGNNFIEDKWDGLVDFRYSVAIENHRTENYWTEKIADCFLAFTKPVYYGCTNIQDFFPKDSYIEIDLDDVERSAYIIKEQATPANYDKSLPAVIEARKLILNEYQFMPKVTSWLSQCGNSVAGKRTITIQPESTYEKGKLVDRLKKKIKNILK